MVHLQQRLDVEDRKTPARLILQGIKPKSSKYQEVFDAGSGSAAGYFGMPSSKTLTPFSCHEKQTGR
jgi:hypothetical protein